MKSNEEMINSLFSRRDEYEESRRARRGRLVKISSAAFLVCVAIVAAVLIPGIGKGNKSVEKNDAAKEAKYFVLDRDWPGYMSVGELVESADDVFAGTVSDIRFSYYDMYSGKEKPATNGDNTYPLIYTVYEISVSKVYKGADEPSKTVLVMGGKKDYKVGEQLAVIAEYGGEANAVPILGGAPDIALGDACIWVTRRSGENCKILSPDAFCFKEDFGATLAGFGYEDVAAFLDSGAKAGADVIRINEVEEIGSSADFAGEKTSREAIGSRFDFTVIPTAPDDLSTEYFSESFGGENGELYWYYSSFSAGDDSASPRWLGCRVTNCAAGDDGALRLPGGEAEKSLIGGTKVQIYRAKTLCYENVGGEPREIDKFVCLFKYRGEHFRIEAVDLTEDELVAAIRSTVG